MYYTYLLRVLSVWFLLRGYLYSLNVIFSSFQLFSLNSLIVPLSAFLFIFFCLALSQNKVNILVRFICLCDNISHHITSQANNSPRTLHISSHHTTSHHVITSFNAHISQGWTSTYLNGEWSTNARQRWQR